MAFACQVSKALHQVALDHGDWSNAIHLIPVPDVLSDPQFGGEEVEMKMVQSYRKAMRELEAHHSTKENPVARKSDDGDPGDAAVSNTQKKREAWKTKQKSKKDE